MREEQKLFPHKYVSCRSGNMNWINSSLFKESDNRSDVSLVKVLRCFKRAIWMESSVFLLRFTRMFRWASNVSFPSSAISTFVFKSLNMFKMVSDRRVRWRDAILERTPGSWNSLLPNSRDFRFCNSSKGKLLRLFLFWQRNGEASEPTWSRVEGLRRNRHPRDRSTKIKGKSLEIASRIRQKHHLYAF